MDEALEHFDALVVRSERRGVRTTLRDEARTDVLARAWNGRVVGQSQQLIQDRTDAPTERGDTRERVDLAAVVDGDNLLASPGGRAARVEHPILGGVVFGY